MKTKILSVTCAVFSVIVFILSLWIMESSRGAYMGMIGVFYASIGLVISLVFAVGGIASGVILLRREKSANETSSDQHPWSLGMISVVTCSLLIIIAVVCLLLFGDLS